MPVRITFLVLQVFASWKDVEALWHPSSSVFLTLLSHLHHRCGRILFPNIHLLCVGWGLDSLPTFLVRIDGSNGSTNMDGSFKFSTNDLEARFQNPSYIISGWVRQFCPENLLETMDLPSLPFLHEAFWDRGSNSPSSSKEPMHFVFLLLEGQNIFSTVFVTAFRSISTLHLVWWVLAMFEIYGSCARTSSWRLCEKTTIYHHGNDLIVWFHPRKMAGWDSEILP